MAGIEHQIEDPWNLAGAGGEPPKPDDSTEDLKDNKSENQNPETNSSVLTKDAEEVLKNIDAGGVPFFISKNLKRILLENNFSDEEIREMRPADIAEQLRKKKTEAIQTENDFDKGFPLENEGGENVSEGGGETPKTIEDVPVERPEEAEKVPEEDKEQKFNDYVEGLSDADKKEYDSILQKFENQESNNMEGSLFNEIKETLKLPPSEVYEFYEKNKDKLTKEERDYLSLIGAVKEGLERKNDKTEGEEDEKNKPPYNENTRIVSNDKIPYTEEKRPVMEDLFLVKGFAEKISAKLFQGEELSEIIRQQGQEILIKNGFSQETVEGMPDQKIKEALDEKIKEAEIQNLSEEAGEKYKKIEEALEKQKNNIEQEAEKAGLFDRIRKIGNFYRKVPFKYKLLIGAGIGVVGLSGVAATGCALALLGQRALGGAGTFVMVEGLLQKLTERNGRERSKKEKQIHTIIALLSGVAVGSRGMDFLNQHLNPDAFMEPDLGQDLPNVTESVGDNIHSTSEETFGILPTENIEIPPQPDLSFTVGGETGTVWDGIEKTLQNQGSFEGLNESQQNVLTDSIKDKLAVMSPEELHQIGISSGNIGLVQPGETIDLSHVLGETAPINNLTEQVDTLPLSEPESSLNLDIVEPENSDIFSNGDNLSSNLDLEIPEQPDILSGDNLSENISQLSPEATAHMNGDISSLYGNLEINQSIDGMKSAHWIGDKGLSNETIGTLFNIDPNLLSSEGVGIESKEAVMATLKHTDSLIKEAKISPKINETIKDFFERAYEKIGK